MSIENVGDGFIPKTPLKQKFPVKIGRLAFRLATQGTGGGKTEPWERRTFEDLAVRCGKRVQTTDDEEAFYEGTIRLMKKMAFSFQKRNPEWYSPEDLIHLCFARVWETLHSYDPNKAMLSTWIYYVCNSVLCKEYNSTKTYKQHMFCCDDNGRDGDEGGSSRGVEKYGCTEEDNLLKLRMREAIVEVFHDHPDEILVLRECFGDPFAENYEPPAKLPSKMEVARNLGLEYNVVYTFFKDVIVPHFKHLFPDFS